MYAGADVFVLPTRGEGWGLPIVEAMAMELPVIVTNHSGPTEYLTDANSFPLRIDGVDNGYAADGSFAISLWHTKPACASSSSQSSSRSLYSLRIMSV